MALRKKSTNDSSEMVNQKHHFAALLESQHADAIIAKLYQPLRWLHPQWIETVIPADFPIDHHCIKTNQFIAEQLNIPSTFDTELSSPLSKFLLLERELISKVIGVLGLSCFQHALKKLISKQIKHAIDQQIGCNACQIVMQKIPFMLSDFPKALLVEDITLNSATNLPNFIEKGLSVFKQICDDDTHFQLLCFILSPDHTASTQQSSLSEETCRKTTLLIRKLAIEIDPPCSNLLK